MQIALAMRLRLAIFVMDLCYVSSVNAVIKNSHMCSKALGVSVHVTFFFSSPFLVFLILFKSPTRQGYELLIYLLFIKRDYIFFCFNDF